MKRFLIDANLPRGVPIWQSDLFLFVADIDPAWSDSEIWNYAKLNGHTIVTKDADFSNRIIVSEPPPNVVHLRIGNLKLAELIAFVTLQWNGILAQSASHKLVQVYRDRVESIA